MTSSGLKVNTCCRLVVLVVAMVTVVSHDVFEGGEVAHWRLVAAEDLGARAKVVGKVLAVLLPHLLVPAQIVHLTVERHVVGRPVTCRTHTFNVSLHPRVNRAMKLKPVWVWPLRSVCVWSEYSTSPGICSTTVSAPSSRWLPRVTLLESTTMYWLLYVPDGEIQHWIRALIHITPVEQTECRLNGLHQVHKTSADQ